MAGRETDVEETLKDPDEIRLSRSDAQVYLFYKEDPFLCRPKIIDIRSDITTQALEDAGWTVAINEQE